MGKGDIKTKRGKIFNGSYGVTRPKKTANVVIVDKPKDKPKDTKKDKPKDTKKDKPKDTKKDTPKDTKKDTPKDTKKDKK